jgi:hypothetical protein
MILQVTAQNLTNEVALYNFLSTFSGTHFMAPRSYLVEIGLVFYEESEVKRYRRQ